MIKRKVLIWAALAILLGLSGVSFVAQAQDNSNGWQLATLINFVSQDINQMWQAEFSNAERTYFAPRAVQGYNRQTRTACGRVRVQTALYCGASHSIHYEINFMNSTLYQIGDFAVAAVIAHEWGHAVQAQLGLINTTSIQRELQADCLAGAYAQHAQTNGVLEEGDYEEGLELFSRIGDQDDTEEDSLTAHGTAEQRVAAYEKGFEEGVSGCF